MARRSDKRGFASMDPERRRRIASEGGRSLRGGRNRDYEEEYDEGYDEYYDEDEEQGVSNRYEEDEDWEEGDEGEYEETGYEDEDEYEDAGYEEEDDDYDRRGRGRGRRSSSGGRRRTLSRRGGNTSRRGFAGIDPDEQRRIARMGGEATSRTHGRGFYEEMGHERGESVRDEYGPEFYSRIGRRGGRARWEEDDEYDRGRSLFNRDRTSSSSRGSLRGRGRNVSSRGGSSSGRSSSGRRGFGSMPREEVRRIASKGGRARWEEDDDRGRGSRSSGRGRSRR